MPLDLFSLTESDAPWLHLVTATASELYDSLHALERTSSRPLVARIVRGTKATTKVKLLDECAAALQFPPHFGANWDAFLDSLSDLSWLNCEAVVLAVLDGTHLLAHAPEERSQFLSVIEEATRCLNAPDRSHPPRSFHVLLHAEPSEADLLQATWPTAQS